MKLPIVFYEYAQPLLEAESELDFSWKSTRNGRAWHLTIPKHDKTGFTVEVEAETYGLYAFADGWHTMAWDATDNPEKLCKEFMGFVRTLLSTDARLEVHYAGKLAYKWIMYYAVEEGESWETTGSLLFNYFGRRRIEILQNRHLPSRYNEFDEEEL